ncbi:MAG: type II toxin-antitoxin system PemK/MazF family toxin [Hormoscilla sp. GUM202]|nr:type II toxin-antitoxin system PemK/MazF family toxin [Hormoscilla sp. GUM202]
MNSDNSQLYVPHQGDIIWLNFTPQAGREQAGRRPALVLSKTRYNRRVGLAFDCAVRTLRDREILSFPIFPMDDPIAYDIC